MTSNPLRPVVITPSYAPDFEYCRLLCQSMERFVDSPVLHYLIVDRRDLKLFQQLAGRYTEVLTVEDILPWWIRRLPGIPKAWFSLKTPPIRNWLLQQIVKIQAARQINGDVAVYIDSDVAFIRPFSFQSLMRNGLVRLYDEPGGNPEGMNTPHAKWHQTASHLLGLSPTPMPAPDYVGNLITWRKDNVVKMCDRLQEVAGCDWIQTLGRVWHFSEYTLYGTFIDRCLGEDSGHYRESNKLCFDYFTHTALSDLETRQLLTQVQPDQVAVMFASKARMPVEQYQPLFEILATTTDPEALKIELLADVPSG